MIPWTWYKAVRIKDGVTIEFGSSEEFEIDEDYELILEKQETARGFRYKHIRSEE